MRTFVALQYVLPHRFLSRVVMWATRWTWTPWKNFLISTVVRNYDVDMSQAIETDPWPIRFSMRFSRAHSNPARAPRRMIANAIASPADGRISQAGDIVAAESCKRKDVDLRRGGVARRRRRGKPYRDGKFVTIYLSPRDYHRVHTPLAGKLRRNRACAGTHFQRRAGGSRGRAEPVRAQRAAGLPFRGRTRSVRGHPGRRAARVRRGNRAGAASRFRRTPSTITRKDFSERDVRLERVDELGRFNMGSTVIVLLPAGAAELDPALTPETGVKVGQSIGHLT